MGCCVCVWVTVVLFNLYIDIVAVIPYSAKFSNVLKCAQTTARIAPTLRHWLTRGRSVRHSSGIQRNLAHALDLNAYLLRPVQRITKYHAATARLK